jgi:multidrug efflux pump subunit AcrA (membrane-fusion protein)
MLCSQVRNRNSCSGLNSDSGPRFFSFFWRPPPHAAAIPVLVSKVTQRAMPVQLTAIGNVGGYTVSLRAQVRGQLLEAHFKDGDFVHEGQLLFTIDPRPYEAASAQAEATLARDKALAASLRSQEQRYTKLLGDGVVSPSNADAS